MPATRSSGGQIGMPATRSGGRQIGMPATWDNCNQIGGDFCRLEEDNQVGD